MRIAILFLLALAGATPVPAQTPRAGSWQDALRRLREAHVVHAMRSARVAASPTTIITESEPNDSIRTADSAALGDRAIGVVNPARDVDTWFVDLTEGQLFSADVDAELLGSPLDAQLVLFAPDGRTVLAFNDDFDGVDSRLSFRVPARGRYFVQLSSFGQNGGGPQATYALNFGTVTCSGVGTEREPNDSPATATRVAVGDSGTGEICPVVERPTGDVDYWAITAQAGTTLDLSVDAASFGFVGDPILALYAPDGTTRLAFNDNFIGSDSRLQFSITTTSTYFAAVANVQGFGDPFRYTLHVGTITPGPGDPITVGAENLGAPLGLAVGGTGDVFVSDVSGGRVLRISADNRVTTFTTGVPSPVSVAFDASGQLLATSLAGGVYRVTPQGQATRVITDAIFPFWIAVAPDGRIWITDIGNRSLRRYSATGQFETSFDGIGIGGSGPGPLAIGPSGDPYVSNGTEIWRLRNGRFERLLRDGSLIWAFAFDLAGNIYAPSPVAGTLKLFDSTGAVLADPFAVGPDAPQAVAFGRDATGATLARVFAIDPQVGRLFEVNPAAVRQRGLPGYVTPPFSFDVAAAGLLGAGGLSAADLQYLDALGNHNGRYDVGDFRAYLRVLQGSNR
jgi:sugar lactone lactonase YvrE